MLIDTELEAAKDRSVERTRAAAKQTRADFVFTIMEAWSQPKDKLDRYQEILDRVIGVR